jgi:hypothetical protein
MIRMRRPQRLGVGILLLWACASSAPGPVRAQTLGRFSSDERVTAVSSKVFNGYARTRLPDGSFKPETYVFGYGGSISTLMMRDDSIDDLSFDALTQTIGSALRGQRYLPGNDQVPASLFIAVFWGTTYGSVNTADGPTKDRIDAENAALLGFDSEAGIPKRYDYLSPWGTTFRAILLRNVHAGPLSALEVNRYFVVLRAFDLRAATREKKLKLLWETRLSLSQRRHDFEKELPEMAQYASIYFGQDSHGLVRKSIPEGRVEIGEPKSLGVEPSK